MMLNIAVVPTFPCNQKTRSFLYLAGKKNREQRRGSILTGKPQLRLASWSI
jgi:hypothetical protein